MTHGMWVMKKVCWLFIFAALLTGCASITNNNQAKKYFDDAKAFKLAVAGADGDVTAIQTLRNQSADPNSIGKDGMTPVLWAMVRGNKSGLQKLLEVGGDANYQTDDGNSVMSLAAEVDDPEFLKIALQHGGNPNLDILHSPYRRPLGIATGPFHLEHVKLLLNAGADVNYQNPVTGNTALDLAADLNQFDIVYYLLENGANYNLKNKLGNTVVFQIENNNIDSASSNYVWRRKVIEFLRSKDIQVNPRIP